MEFKEYRLFELSKDNKGYYGIGASAVEYIAEDFYEKLKNGKMNSGDVLLYKDGAYTGKVSMCLNWQL